MGISPGCYCSETNHGECSICRDERELRERIAEVKSWNWNLSPHECAARARELGWSRGTLEQTMQAAGFKPGAIAEVVYELENEGPEDGPEDGPPW